jgi:hypothetical protein
MSFSPSPSRSAKTAAALQHASRRLADWACDPSRTVDEIAALYRDTLAPTRRTVRSLPRATARTIVLGSAAQMPDAVIDHVVETMAATSDLRTLCGNRMLSRAQGHRLATHAVRAFGASVDAGTAAVEVLHALYAAGHLRDDDALTAAMVALHATLPPVPHVSAGLTASARVLLHRPGLTSAQLEPLMHYIPRVIEAIKTFVQHPASTIEQWAWLGTHGAAQSGSCKDATDPDGVPLTGVARLLCGTMLSRPVWDRMLPHVAANDIRAAMYAIISLKAPISTLPLKHPALLARRDIPVDAFTPGLTHADGAVRLATIAALSATAPDTVTAVRAPVTAATPATEADDVPVSDVSRYGPRRGR